MAAQNQNKVSLPVIKRLPKYYRYISDMHNNGIVKVSSSELARMMGTTASQVRQDFNCFGGFGQQGIGYHVDVLLSEVGFTSDEREPDMHMDGRRAGELATRAGVGRMIATHIQPWTPRERVVSEVRQTWAGPLDVAASRMEVSF